MTCSHGLAGETVRLDLQSHWTNHKTSGTRSFGGFVLQTQDLGTSQSLSQPWAPQESNVSLSNSNNDHMHGQQIYNRMDENHVPAMTHDQRPEPDWNVVVRELCINEYQQSSMNWSNFIKKSGRKFLCNDVRDWWNHTEHNYFRLLVLNVVLQATESERNFSKNRVESCESFFCIWLHNITLIKGCKYTSGRTCSCSSWSFESL